MKKPRTETEAMRPGFLKASAKAEEAIRKRKTGLFSTSDGCYIEVLFWRGFLEVEAVADNMVLLRKSRRRAGLPPLAPGGRHVPVSPREREILDEYVSRGPKLVIRRMRTAMSEAIKCGLDRKALARMAEKDRRLRGR
jgi:hypothetical protein